MTCYLHHAFTGKLSLTYGQNFGQEINLRRHNLKGTIGSIEHLDMIVFAEGKPCLFAINTHSCVLRVTHPLNTKRVA